MRAVNLVPPESRTGRVTPGKSGGAVYAVLGGLVVLLLALSAMAITKKQQSQAEQELASVQQSTAAFERVATQYAAYAKASQDVQQRISMVRALAQARFDWAGSLRELARLIPAHTQVLSLDASVSSETASGGGGSVRGNLAVPAISITGCSLSQVTVADLVTRLQAMRRVENVTLENSKSTEDAGGGGGSSSGDSSGAGSCSLPGISYSFAITVFYAPGTSQSSDSITPQGTTPATTTTTSSTGN